MMVLFSLQDQLKTTLLPLLKGIRGGGKEKGAEGGGIERRAEESAQPARGDEESCE